MTLAAYVSGIGVLGPGLADWARTASLLADPSAYAPESTVLPAPAMLPPAERRRTGRAVRLALAVASEAANRAAIDPSELASVFSSSGGDGQNCHELCQALALESREISPTKFANSVHNAASGYWGIAAGATRESTALCAHDASFCAGLLEALTQVTVQSKRVLLVAYDTEYPQPLRAKRPIPDAFGVALLLTPQRTATSLARIEATLAAAVPPPAVSQETATLDRMSDPRLEFLRSSIPAARCLPLLQQIALQEPGLVALAYLDQSRTLVQVAPCE
jgi:hypothetical protein